MDTQKGLWHREDDVQVRSFCTVGDQLLFVNEDGIWSVTDGGTGEKVDWFVQTGIFGDEEPNHKYLSALTVRLSLTPGTKVRFLVQYDSCGGWHSLAYITGKHLNSFSLPLRPRRCDHLRLRIEGQGEAKIYAITLTMEQGSEFR